MENENWINEVFDSTKGMQKAEPSPFLFEQISVRLQSGREVIQADPFLKWGLTSLVLVMLALNVFSIAKSPRHVSQEPSTTSYFNNAIIYNY